MVLQLPISIFNFIVAIHNSSNKDCFNCSLPHSTFSLQSYWSTVGFLEIIIPTLGIYFFTVHLTTGILDETGMQMFEGLLTLIIEIKSVVSFIFYMNILQGEIVWLYSRFIVSALVVNMYINTASFLLGIVLLAKYLQVFFVD
jgi:hypothetical protein